MSELTLQVAQPELGPSGSHLYIVDFPASKPVSQPTLVSEALKAIHDSAPTLSEDGVGGTYFLNDKYGTPKAVFKPADEEPGAINNPKHLLEKPLIQPGHGYIREIAAFVLDDLMPFELRAGVPETRFVTGIRHRSLSGGLSVEKFGSVQKFVSNIGSSDSMSPSRFSVDDVHRIAVFDLRVYNLDRNSENILVHRNAADKSLRLVPIDHSYILPTALQGAYFEWASWPQAKVPFSAEMLRSIENLDVQGQAKILRNLGIEEDAVAVSTYSTVWLKIGAAAGLNLHDIATFAAAPIPTEVSRLSRVVDCLMSFCAHPTEIQTLLPVVLRSAAHLIHSS